MTSSPSVLSEILRDPVALSNLTNTVPNKRSKSKPRRGSSSSYREYPSNSPSVMGLVLAEEERQSHQLKAMLRSTGDKLESETRRADRAEKRAQLDEASNRDLTVKLQAAEAARYIAESESERTKEEVRRLQMQIDSLQSQLKRAHESVATVERRKLDAEESLSKTRETVRKLQASLNEVQVRADGREESRRVEIQKYYDRGHKEGRDAGGKEGYEDGKSHGYERGRAAGFEEGKRAGRERGWEEGRAQGRKEERQHAMRAFDKFLQEEIRNRWDDESEIDVRSFLIYRSPLTSDIVQCYRTAQNKSVDGVGQRISKML